MAPLWDDVLADVASSRRHFGRAVEIFDRNLSGPDASDDYVTAMAFQHAMQSGYTSFEAAMRRFWRCWTSPSPWDRTPTRPCCVGSAVPPRGHGRPCSRPT